MKNTTKEKFQQLIDRLLCPETLLFLLVLLAVGVLVFCDSSGLSLAMAVIPGVAGGKHVTEEPLTRALAQRESPELLLNEIDRRIVKIRPMATPIDQLSRWAGAKRSGSMVVDYYSVDTRPTSALTTTEFTGVDATGDKRFQRARLTVDNIDMFEVSETLLVRGVRGFEPDGVTPSSQDIVKWGIDFSEIRSKFGKLYVLLSEVFDECGMENNGMIIDPEYLQKYSHIPFSTEELNLKSAGVRNTDAIVLTEASCMTLRYPKAHLRIVQTA